MLKKVATFGLLVFALNLTASCKKQEFHLDDSSKVKLANIPQSTLKHQGDIGLCWSYATVALIESDYLIRTGKEVDLSEEMLGFFRLAHNIKDYVGCNIWAKNEGVKPEDAKCPELEDDGYAGANPVSPNEYYYQFAGDLIGRWGIVPESASGRLDNSIRR